MRIAFGLVVAGSGCAQVFGIDDTTGSSESASLELRRVSIGATVTTAPLDLGSGVPTFYAGSASKPGTLAMPGLWTTTLAAADSVAYKAPDLPAPFQHAFAIAAGGVKASFTAFEHPNPQPAPASSLTVDVMLPSPFAAGEGFEIAAIGAWTEHVLAGAELPPANGPSITTTIPYTMFMPMTASPAAQITTADVVVVLRYVAGALTGALVVPAFDQNTGSMLTGTMAAVTPATPFDAAVDPAAVATRYGMVVPALANLALAWRLDVAPGRDVGAMAGIQLATGGVTMATTSIAASYTNPFDAQPWKPVLTYTSSAGRTFMLGGATTTLSASLTTYVEPAAGLVLDLPAGLPQKVAIAGTDLVTDGMIVTLDPTTPLDIDITSDRPANTYYTATIEDIAVVGTQVTRTLVTSVGGTSPTLVLPPNMLQHNHTYAIDAQCISGAFPQAATGDLQTFALPASVGTATSAVFTVAP